VLYSFIVIPGVGTLSPGRWGESDRCDWLTRAGRPDTLGLVVFSFEHNLSGRLTWERVSVEGSRFLDAIQSLREKPDVSSLDQRSRQ
jgi:hypothetical protein